MSGWALAASRGVSALVALAASGAFAWTLSRPIAVGDLQSPGVVLLDQRLSRSPTWDVVVLGNSTANLAVHVPTATRLLRTRVVKATLPGSSPATWYAALQRVYRAGFEPRLVVVAAPSHVFLQARPVESVDLRQLVELTGSTDPRVRHLLGGDGVDWALRTFDLRRQGLRAHAVESIADLATSGADDEVRDAMDEGFQGVGGAGAELAPRIRDAVVEDPRDTALPDIVELVHAHHGSVLFARTPTRLEEVDPGQDRRDVRLRSWCRDHDTLYLTFDATTFEDTDFRDALHLSSSGGVRFTDRLARAALTWMSRPSLLESRGAR